MLLTTEKRAGSERAKAPGHDPHFLKEVLEGLRSRPKKLNPKYFYDERGDRLFQKIMSCQDYYVSRCEAEILRTHSAEIAAALNPTARDFDLIELGAGDASKTLHLLAELQKLNSGFRYLPVDISGSMIQYLERELPVRIGGLVVEGLHGEYLDMLNKAGRLSQRRKAVLFLGSNIGNMDSPEALLFLRELRAALNAGDRLLIGFDLKKDPATILAAYNDREGYTRDFNLNLLERINRELGGDFRTEQFYHFPSYDPNSGACKSFLVSRQDQQISIAGERFHFGEGEAVFMELSQKYDPEDIAELAESAGFQIKTSFSDSRGWFRDSVWECV